MNLRHVTLERYGCFGSGEFEFRRGLNLVCGGNETGKTILLSVLPAVVLGVEHGTRLRSWGNSLSCRASLLFEAGDRGMRLTRELESNMVRLEECGADGQWRESFSGRVSPGGDSPDHVRYFGHLQRLFGGGGESLLRALLDAVHSTVVLDGDGCLAAGLTVAPPRSDPNHAASPAESPDAVVARQAEIAALEAELVIDREEFRKGEEYLAWIRKRWKSGSKARASEAKAVADKAADRKTAALDRERSELAVELQSQGLPLQLPDSLDEMFATAEELRQELSGLQQELTPLQRSRQAVAMPGNWLPLLVTLVAVVASGTAFYLESPWLLAVAGGCGALLLLVWAIFLVRLGRARKERASLDREIQGVEQKRSAALVRQSELAEQFEASGLPSAPVEMVKLQQLCRRNQGLIDRCRELRRQLGVDVSAQGADQHGQADSKHLRPEDLPDAERRLTELGASLRRRESRLQALREGAPVPRGDDGAATPVAGVLTTNSLLPVVGQMLDRLTGGRYREVRLDGGRLQLEAAPGHWILPGACSRGTAEVLVLAIRLALCQASGAMLPLPIDDLPASLDSTRRQAALRVVERIAADHQVLLASCDEELAKRAVREHWPLINLNQPRSRQIAASKEVNDAGQLHLL